MDNRSERESRKRRLRARLIDSGTVFRDEEEREAFRERKRRKRRFWLVAIVLVVVLAAAGFFGFSLYQKKHQYTKVRALWEKELVADASSGYEAYGENLLRYTRDGAVYMDRKGEEVWNQSFEMKSPFVSVSGDYAAIADRNGYGLYICDKNGCQGVVTTTLPISKLSISSTGITVAILEDMKSNVIAFYDKTGTKLQVEVQTTLSGNGYPIDLSISPNGMMLMVSYVYLDEGLIQNQVVFYNFDDEGQSVKDRLVGGFKEYGSSIVARVRFLDNTHACAFAEDRLCFYSLENTVQPELVKQVDISGEITRIFYSEDYAGAIVSEEGNPGKLFLYGGSGKELFVRELEKEYEYAEISGSHVLLYGETECRIYNESGDLKYDGTLSGGTEKLLCLGERRYIQIGQQVMRELELE
ncbi:MAG: hypothetical protein HFI63_09400 [Lachnospiraceae bacterium]|nr:hypothetical protein [Lachnospiraceae bacterium]